MSMSYNRLLPPHVYPLNALSIIPSEDVPNGYRRTEDMTIFVSPWNYALLKTMEAKSIVVTVGFLKEMTKPE